MNKMSLNYLCFGSYWRNLTSPMSHWHRGTAVQIDTLNAHPEMQVVVGKLGTDIVVLTMAARITQSIFTLARNILHRRPLSWKIIPGDWKSKAFQAVLWLCWNIIDFLLAVEVRNVFVYKSFMKHSTHHHTEQSMSTFSIQCCWGCEAEQTKKNMVPEKEPPIPRMECLQENSCMEEVCDQKVFPDMNIMVSKETLLQSCTNPFILSMICAPSEDGESMLPSEESDLSEFESDGEDEDRSSICEESSVIELQCKDEEPENDSSRESSVDSGMSKEEMHDSEEESDWSDEDDDDSWDAESDEDSRDDDLWASFCRTDDPYNPLSFAMPTRSPKQQEKKEAPVTSSEKPLISGRSCSSIVGDEECQSLKCTMQSQAKKPQNCASQKDESPSLDELKQNGNQRVKKVRFSPNVTVHHMVTWSDAYRLARKGPWEEYARDRSRFQKRIAETEATIGFCLEPGHREKIWAARHSREN